MLALAKYLADITNGQASRLTPKKLVKIPTVGEKVKTHLDKHTGHFGCKRAVVKNMLEIILDLPKGFLTTPPIKVGTVLFYGRAPVVYLGAGQYFLCGKGKIKIDRKSLTYRTITIADLTPYAAYVEAIKAVMPVTFI
jgi:hypothetical protein